MVIREERPITMAEVVSMAGEGEKSEKIKQFIRSFPVVDVKKALAIKEALANLEILKLKERHLVKIVDFLPSTAAELNKILSDVSLDQEEVEKILGAVATG